MQKRHITHILETLQLDYQGIEIDIVRDAELIDSGFMGYTFPNGKRIQLYPDAFKSRKDLVETLGHERIHCEQIKLFGEAETVEELDTYEKAARFSEGYWWEEYKRRSGYGGSD